MIDLLLLLSLISGSRVQPLHISPQLTRIAESRAIYLCNHDFSHNGWKKYPSNFAYRGENLASSFEDASTTHKALMDSPNHKENIVSDDYTHIGIAEKCGIVVEEFGGYSK